MNAETRNDLKVFERQVAQTANSMLGSPVLAVAMSLLFPIDRPLFVAWGMFAFGIGITLKIAQRRFRTDLRSAMSLIRMTLYLNAVSAVSVCAYLYWTQPIFASAFGILLMMVGLLIGLGALFFQQMKIDEIIALHLPASVTRPDADSQWSRLSRTGYVTITKMLDVATQFDPVFLGKVVRVAAVACVLEFLLALALAMQWMPADSKCHSGAVDVGVLIPSGGIALWTSILAIFWKHFARMISDYRGTDESRSQSNENDWLFFRPRAARPNTALFTAIFLVFAASGIVPIIILFQGCWP